MFVPQGCEFGLHDLVGLLSLVELTRQLVALRQYSENFFVPRVLHIRKHVEASFRGVQSILQTGYFLLTGGNLYLEVGHLLHLQSDQSLRCFFIGRKVSRLCERGRWSPTNFFLDPARSSTQTIGAKCCHQK